MVFFKRDIKEEQSLTVLGHQGGGAVIDSRELDIVEIPLEAVAAYWLSIKKVSGKGGRAITKAIKQEAGYTSEPFVKYLLEMLLSSFSDEEIRRYCQFKIRTLLRELQRRFILISIGILGVAAKENPGQVLIRLMSKFPIPPASERKIFKGAQEFLRLYEGGEIPSVDISHTQHPELLITNLIFYCMLARRKGASECQVLTEKVNSPLFREGISLIVDGFDRDFIKYRLNLQQREVLSDTEQKMNMSVEMALALRRGVSYEDMFRIAQSFLI